MVTERRTSDGWLLVLVLLSASLLAACQAARMPLPDDLAEAERLVVSGRHGLRFNQRLRFGTYETDRVSRTGTRGRERGMAESAQQRDRRQAYRFTLLENGQAHWFVACEIRLTNVRFDLVVVEVHPTDESGLYCNVQSLADSSHAWELDLQERRGRPLAGTLALGDEQLDVIGTNELRGSLPLGATSGYQITAGQEVLGSVEVVNRGAVWLHRDLDPERRRVLAAVAAALLLLDDLRETLAS
jgi:hypothetical protein